MKLSKNTIAVLKNYNQINQSIVILPGKLLSTFSKISHDIVSHTQIEEEIPVKVVIRDFQKFISLLSIFGEPEIEFLEKYMTISEGRKTCQFFYSEDDEKIIDSPRNKKVRFEEDQVLESFTLKKEDIQRITQASNVLQIGDLQIKSVGGDVVMMLIDESIISSNQNDVEGSPNFSVVVGKTDKEFRHTFKSLNLQKILQSDEYEAKIVKIQGGSETVIILYLSTVIEGLKSEYWIASTVVM